MMNSQQLVEKIVDLADDKQAANIVTLNIAKKSSLADYFVICEGTSDPHVRTIADFVIDELKKVGERPLHKDEDTAREWIVVDFGSVMLHVFQPEVRQRYALEDLWSATTSRLDATP